MTTTSPSLSSIFPTFLKPNPNTNNLHFLYTTHKSLSPASTTTLSCKSLPTKLHSKSTQSWRIHAVPEEAISKTLETSQEIVAASDDGVAKLISALLFAAFVGLSVLTIGVIYISVTDFLQKREKEKFEKEEAANKKKKKKGGKKKVVRAKSGPRGFGQKIQEEDDDDE